MAGQSVIQIVAKGQQDFFLTQKPVITFFKAGWKQYTAFCIEAIEQTFNGTVNFGNRSIVTVTRSGDGVSSMYLQIGLPALAGTSVAWTREIGHALIDYVTLNVGSQPIDKHYGEFLSIWNELTMDKNHSDSYDVLIGNTTDLYTPASSISATTIYVPMRFFFNRNYGQMLPLIGMSFSEVKLEVSLRPYADVTVGTLSSTPAITYCSLWVDYVFLSKEERKMLTQNPLEYLIDIVQYNGAETISTTNVKNRLTFNHPTKALFFVLRSDANMSAKRVLDFTDGSVPYDGDDTVSLVGLTLNSNDRFTPRDAANFNIIQPLQHWPSAPRRGIYTYSFGLYPSKPDPTGTLNMSRIDNVSLNIATTLGSSPSSLLVYALSYNLFRVRGGQAGAAFNS